MIKMASLKTRTARLVVVIGLAVLAGIGFYCWKQSQPLPIPHHLQNLGGDFELQSADGKLALHDLRGKVVLLYFGYMNCPDVCPLTLSNWADAFNQLEDAEAEKVRGLLVSVDPDRDSPEALKEYTQYFHSNILGVTGNHATLSEVTWLYRADYSLEHKDERKDYRVDHTSFVYVIDPLGKLRGLLAHDSSPKDILKSVRNALKARI
jgi:protein SCO1/2